MKLKLPRLSSRASVATLIGAVAVVLLGGYGLYVALSGFTFHRPSEILQLLQAPLTHESADTSLSQGTCDKAYEANDTQEVVIPVSWTAPKKISSLPILLPAGALEYQWSTEFYTVGNIVSGAYAGSTVVLGVSTAGGVFHFLTRGGVVTLLAKSSDISYQFDENGNSTHTPYFQKFLDCSQFQIDTQSALEGLVFPKSFTHAGVLFTLEADDESSYFDGMGGPSNNTRFGYNYIVQHGTNESGNGATYLFADYTDDFIEAFNQPGIGTLYTDKHVERPSHNGFYAKAPDGTIRSYRMQDPPFFTADNSESTVAATWIDGTRARGDYIPYEFGGCSGQRDMTVIRDIGKEDLIQMGTSDRGDVLYGYKDTNTQHLHDIYEHDYPQGWFPDAPSYEAFIAMKPVFLWYDPLGRLIEFQNVSLFNGGGKCKPVIYLYPEKTSIVRVRVSPLGGLTETIPAYGDGWNVRATPTGSLTDLATGNTFPYLYWEGIGPNRTPREGFVVDRASVPALFARVLPRLGLSTSESVAFRAYWEPRMSDAPFYFVTFLSKEAIDAIAPLSVTPEPSSVIRVFMEYKPLWQYTVVNPLILPAQPARTGFTVVEWGGSALLTNQ